MERSWWLLQTFTILANPLSVSTRIPSGDVIDLPQCSLAVDLVFLADRTNSRAYTTVLCPSVCHPSAVLWLNGHITCYVLLTEQLSEAASRKWPMGNWVVLWPMSSHDHERSSSWPQYAQGPTCWKQLEMLFSCEAVWSVILATAWLLVAHFLVVWC